LYKRDFSRFKLLVFHFSEPQSLGHDNVSFCLTFIRYFAERIKSAKFRGYQYSFFERDVFDGFN